MRQEVPPLLFGDADDPFQGVVPPEYIPNRITIPTLEEIHAPKEVGSKALVVIIDLMSGGGHRNGEAFAANLEGMVANDVYRITEQIEGKTRQRSPLKHRRAGDFREVPMPATVRESLLSYAHDVGADQNGFLLRTRRSAYWAHTTLDYQWSAARKRAGMTRKPNPYSLRHFFASNCLPTGSNQLAGRGNDGCHVCVLVRVDAEHDLPVAVAVVVVVQAGRLGHAGTGHRSPAIEP